MLLAAALLGAQADAQNPESFLRLALEKQRSLNATVFQTRFDEMGGQMLIKVQFAGQEGMKITMLSPVSRAGIVSVDDTKEFRVYYPDRSLVVAQPSPAAHQPKVDWRMKQIRKNYRLSFGELDEVAGRSVRPIVITPRHDALPTRTMYVDTSTHMVLRYTIDTGSGKPSLFFDTREVIYRRDGSPSDLSIPSGYEKFEVKREPGPRPLSSVRSARAELGFEPRQPKELPLGFRAHAVHVLGSGERSFVAVRLSDGMFSVTVFQWLASRFPRDPGGRGLATAKDDHGVKYSVSTIPGERLSRSAALSILSAFLQKEH
jgi:outer membrane lipoprotein-sorting protein